MRLLSIIKSNKKKSIAAVSVLSLLLITISFFFLNKAAPIAWGWWGPYITENGVAIAGYDPVVYFQEKIAKKGNTINAYTWQNTEWYFASNENKLVFQAFPEKYAPQFGGFCALAVSIGMTYATNPEIWHIQDDKLYLFEGENPRKEWLAKISEGVIQQSSRNWAKRP